MAYECKHWGQIDPEQMNISRFNRDKYSFDINLFDLVNFTALYM